MASSPPIRNSLPRVSTAIVTMADDSVADWLIALLNSIRRHEAELPVYLLPYSPNLARTRRCCTARRVQILESMDLDGLIQIAQPLAEGRHNPRHYQKLAALEIAADRIIFLDADIVLLAPISPFADLLEQHGCDFLYYERNLDMVYDPGPFRDRMVAEYATAGFNSGVWIARSGLLDRQDLAACAQAALPFRDQLRCVDQGFFNYLADTRRWKKAALPDLAPGLSRENWAFFDYRPTGSGYRLTAGDFVQENAHVILLHWAGFSKSDSFKNIDFFLEARFLHLRPRFFQRICGALWVMRRRCTTRFTQWRRRLAGQARKLGLSGIVDRLRRLCRI